MLTKSVEYAIKSLILIKHQEKMISVLDICSNLSIPSDYTAKILRILTKKGYINSQRGPGGGFISNDYNKSLKELIIDIDGCFIYDKCALGLSECSDINPCPLHDYFKPIKSKILSEFLEVTIEEICKNPNRVLFIE
jgi:Rrf2 family transcriptional regulator, iron-sulfur cluster assembly transcription factor